MSVDEQNQSKAPCSRPTFHRRWWEKLVRSTQRWGGSLGTCYKFHPVLPPTQPRQTLCSEARTQRGLPHTPSPAQCSGDARPQAPCPRLGGEGRVVCMRESDLGRGHVCEKGSEREVLRRWSNGWESWKLGIRPGALHPGWIGELPGVCKMPAPRTHIPNQHLWPEGQGIGSLQKLPGDSNVHPR